MTLGRSQICDRTSFRIPHLKCERQYEGFLCFAYLALTEIGFMMVLFV